MVLLGGNAATQSITLGPLALGTIRFSLDPLSAAFLIPVFLLTGLCAVYGLSCLAPFADKRHVGAAGFFYNMLAFGMAVVLSAADAFIFLLAWEIMSLAPFFLISLNDDSPQGRKAGWLYLVVSHAGVLCLLGFFALISATTGGDFSFQSFLQNAHAPQAGLLFMLALAGFGAKLGLMPLHIWMPETYPAAPNHVAALMAGAMVNTGSYGLLRALSFIGPGETWWAVTLIGLGIASGIIGILLALVQPGIKRVLAYSSVENMGIICLGLGIALLCLQQGRSGVAALAFTGILLHMVNHALTKGLLFLCAGAVRDCAGTASMRLLGGLQKRMPFVGVCFALGAASIAALPPFNGFAGEFLLYVSMVLSGAASAAGFSGPGWSSGLSGAEFSLLIWTSLFALAAIGGFGLFCFARVYAMSFLGEARSVVVAHAQDPPRRERVVLLALVLLSLGSAFNAPHLAGRLYEAASPLLHMGSPVPAPQTASLAPSLRAAPARETLATLPQENPAHHAMPPGFAAPDMQGTLALLSQVNSALLLGILAVAAVFLLRRRLLRNRTQGTSPTWDCGYIAPNARMQYTAGSFSQPAAQVMRTMVRQEVELPAIEEYFPSQAKALMRSPDWMTEGIFAPLVTRAVRVADWCKGMQHGHLNGYILYILVTLVALLAWKLG